MRLSVQHYSMSIRKQRLKILAFEGWDGGSHGQVRRTIMEHSRHEWTWVTRPARSWKWRLRTAAVDLVDRAGAEGHLQMRPNLIFATSMISLGDLRYLLPSGFNSLP